MDAPAGCVQPDPSVGDMAGANHCSMVGLCADEVGDVRRSQGTAARVSTVRRI